MVCFFGGENNLDQTLLEKFKGKIKDTHVPQNNNSIVFKFSVSSKGKISAIDIQSNVTLELEQIIRKHTLELSNWIKGNKAINVIYTVYITYN